MDRMQELLLEELDTTNPELAGAIRLEAELFGQVKIVVMPDGLPADAVDEAIAEFTTGGQVLVTPGKNATDLTEAAEKATERMLNERLTELANVLLEARDARRRGAIGRLLRRRRRAA